MSVNDVPGHPDYFYSLGVRDHKGVLDVDVIRKADRRAMCSVRETHWEGPNGIHAQADYAIRTIETEEAEPAEPAELLECGCPAQYVADHGDHQEGCKWCNEDPPQLTAPQVAQAVRRNVAARGGSRRDSPLAGRADTTEAEELLGRLKADGMLTQTADGRYHLRTYGRQALTALSLIMLEEEGVVRHEQP